MCILACWALQKKLWLVFWPFGHPSQATWLFWNFYCWCIFCSCKLVTGHELAFKKIRLSAQFAEAFVTKKPNCPLSISVSAFSFISLCLFCLNIYSEGNPPVGGRRLESMSQQWKFTAINLKKNCRNLKLAELTVHTISRCRLVWHFMFIASNRTRWPPICLVKVIFLVINLA